MTVDLPNAKGSGIALLKAKEALRKCVDTMEVVITDLTWTDVLPPDFLFEFDLVLVPSSLSRVELDSTLEFVNRFSFVFNSRLRNPPKLVIVPSPSTTCRPTRASSPSRSTPVSSSRRR